MKMDGWHDLIAGELPKLRMEKLEGFGFRREGDTCVYEEDLLDGDFHLLVRVTEDGVISTLLLDAKTEEPYVLHHVEQAQGAFVGEVRAAFWEVLNRIGESCGEYGLFTVRMWTTFSDMCAKPMATKSNTLGRTWTRRSSVPTSRKSGTLCS